MKQSVSPAVIVGAIVVVVAIACFFGVRALFPQTFTSNLSAADSKTKMEQSVQQQQQNMANSQSHVPAGAPAGSEDYMRRRQSGMQ